jgi:hypothetical protein
MPDFVVHITGLVVDGLSYDVIKLAIGALVVSLAGAAVGKITNRLETFRETIYVGIAIFVGVFVFVAMISPRSQIPQLAGTVQSVMAGPSNDGKDTIAVVAINIINSGTMHSIVKNEVVTATINSINYQGVIIAPAPPTFTFNDLLAPEGAPRAIVYHGGDSLIEKGMTPIQPGGETSGLLFVLFRGIDANLFKTGVDYTISYDDALSRNYTARISSTAQRGPITLAAGIHAELMCPVPKEQPNMSVGTPPKL